MAPLSRRSDGMDKSWRDVAEAAEGVAEAAEGVKVAFHSASKVAIFSSVSIPLRSSQLAAFLRLKIEDAIIRSPRNSCSFLIKLKGIRMGMGVRMGMGHQK